MASVLQAAVACKACLLLCLASSRLALPQPRRCVPACPGTMVDTRPFSWVGVPYFTASTQLVDPSGAFVGVGVIAFSAASLDESLATTARSKDVPGIEIYIMEERSPHFLVASSTPGEAFNGTQRISTSETRVALIRERYNRAPMGRGPRGRDSSVAMPLHAALQRFPEEAWDFLSSSRAT